MAHVDFAKDERIRGKQSSGPFSWVGDSSFGKPHPAEVRENELSNQKKEGKWISVAEGQSIGRKRIERFDPVQTEKIRLKVLETLPLPKIRLFAAYPES